MTHPLRFEERRVTLRLSDLPLDVRQKAADQLVAQEIRDSSPEDALLIARAFHQIAQDPITAAELMPGECENKIFQVSVDAYLEVVADVFVPEVFL